MCCCIFSFNFSARMELLFFHLAERERNESCVEGNKSRMPRGFITQTLPVLLFFFSSASRCRNIHYMHEESSLAARIDPASPVPQHVSITSTVGFFRESVMRRALCPVSCYTQVRAKLKVGSSEDGVSARFSCSLITQGREGNSYCSLQVTSDLSRIFSYKENQSFSTI